MTLPIHAVGDRQFYEIAIPVWMQNSRLIKDHLERGEVFVLWLDTGTMGTIPGSTMCFQDVPIVHPAQSSAPDIIDVEHYRNKLRAIVREARAALGE